MWKKVFTHTHEKYTIEVNKDYRGRKAIYSFKLGFVSDGKDIVIPYLDPDKLDSASLVNLWFAGTDFVEQDRKKDADDERRRVEDLAGKGRQKNPTANTGLSRFKKKKEEEPAAEG